MFPLLQSGVRFLRGIIGHRNLLLRASDADRKLVLSGYSLLDDNNSLQDINAGRKSNDYTALIYILYIFAQVDTCLFIFLLCHELFFCVHIFLRVIGII